VKLSKILNGYSQELSKREELSGLLDFATFLSKSGSDTGRTPTIGVDTIVNAWIRQQFAFREQLIEDLITLSRTVSELASPILHLTNEVFRRGLTWEAKFAKKCEKCGKEFETIVEECDKCGSKEFRDPDENQLEIFKTFLKDANIFDQSLEDVLRQLHNSINTVDDGYLYISKEYKKDKDSKGKDIVRSKPMEIRHLRPAAVEFDLDEVGLPKNKHWICRFHRERVPADKPGKCPETDCEAELIPAMYRYKHRGQMLYLLDSEVCHESKFYPAETYGYSPILIIFEKALSILGMDRTLFRYFFERKMPSSMVMVATDDTDSIRNIRSTIIAQLRENPDYIPIVGYSARQGSRGRVDMVRLFHTLQEMDYLPVRQEIRERIAATWGLPPMWQSEYAGSGGLSGQSQQLVQFSRVVESDQRMFNEKIFPFIADAFNITDWKVMLQQPEEKAEATRIQFAQQRVSVANMLKQLGFKIEIKEGVNSVDDIDFKISGEMEEQQQGGMGGYPGMAGEEEGGEGNQFGFSEKGWTNQILEKGFTLDSVHNIASLPNGHSAITFKSGDSHYVAMFQPLGQLIDVWSYDPFGPEKPAKPDRKLSARTRQESQIFKPEQVELDDDE